MALPWIAYAGLVVFGATGLHFFSKMAKDTLDPLIGLLFTMFAGLIVALCCIPFAKGSVLNAFHDIKGMALYSLIGVCIAVANLGIFWMFQAGAPISIATPLVRFAPGVFAIILGILFFHESLKLQHVLGFIIIAAGVTLVLKP